MYAVSHRSNCMIQFALDRTRQHFCMHCQWQFATQYYVISCNTIQTPEPIIELHSSFTFGRCTIINVELETQIVV